MKDMGGLRKFMPVTHIVFLIACLAIAGIPPFAGFFSKEEILLAAFQSNKIIYGIGVFASGLTAFYMFRLYFSVFWNNPKERDNHHSEGPLAMKLPLLLLACCTLFAGFIPFGKYISANGRSSESPFHLLFSIAPVLLALTGIVVAMWLYKKETDKPRKVASLFTGLYRAAYRKFYIDEIYSFITKKIIFNMIGRPAAWIDKNIIDGLVNGSAAVTGKVSSAIKGIQSGTVQGYAIYFFSGIILLAVIFIYLWQ